MAKIIGDYSEEQRLAEQQAIADALREQGTKGNTGAGYHGGKVFMRGNGWGNLISTIAGAGLGAYNQGQRQKLQDTRDKQYADAMATMPSATMQREAWTPEQQAAGPTQEAPTMQALPKSARQLQQENTKWMAGLPNIPQLADIKKFGLQQALTAPEKQAAQEAAIEDRKEARLDKAMEAFRIQAQREQDNLRRDRERAEDRQDNIRLTASLRQSGGGGGGGAPVNQDAADFIAARFLEGDQNALVGISRNKELHGAVMGSIARQAKEGGINAKEAVQRGLEFGSERAAQRKIGERGANVEMAANEAANMIPIVSDLSKKVPRTDFPTLNAAGNVIKKQSGDPNITAFDQSIDTFINAYARAISPSGVPTVADKKRAHEKLNAGFSQGQLDATVGVMKQEMDAALKSPGQASAARRETRVGKPEGKAEGKPGAVEEYVRGPDGKLMRKQ